MNILQIINYITPFYERNINLQLMYIEYIELKKYMDERLKYLNNYFIR